MNTGVWDASTFLPAHLVLHILLGEDDAVEKTVVVCPQVQWQEDKKLYESCE